jgi:hypothetical protein
VPARALALLCLSFFEVIALGADPLPNDPDRRLTPAWYLAADLPYFEAHQFSTHRAFFHARILARLRLGTKTLGRLPLSHAGFLTGFQRAPIVTKADARLLRRSGRFAGCRG